MSTEHTQPEISDREDKKPDIILDYNSYKGGVDPVDQMLDTYPAQISQFSLAFGRVSDHARCRRRQRVCRLA